MAAHKFNFASKFLKNGDFQLIFYFWKEIFEQQNFPTRTKLKVGAKAAPLA